MILRRSGTRGWPCFKGYWCAANVASTHRRYTGNGVFLPLSVQPVTYRGSGQQRLHRPPCKLLDDASASKFCSSSASRTRTGRSRHSRSWNARSTLGRSGRCGSNAPSMKPRSPRGVSGSRSVPAAGRSQLERRWNEALLHCEELKQQAAEFERQQARSPQP